MPFSPLCFKKQEHFSFTSTLIKCKMKENEAEYLPEKDVAVCAEVQGVAVLLSVRIAAAQLKVNFFPLQVTFI